MIRLTVLSETEMPVDILDMGLDVAGGHPFGVHGQDFLFDVLADAGLVLFQHLGLEFPFPITRHQIPPHRQSWFAAFLLLWPFRLLSVSLFL